MKIRPVQFTLLFFTLPFPAIAANPIPIGDIDVSVEITEQPKIIIETCREGPLNNISLKRSLIQGKKIYHAQTCVAVKIRRVKGGGGFRVWQQQPLILHPPPKIRAVQIKHSHRQKFAGGTMQHPCKSFPMKNLPHLSFTL
ncbi:alpha-related fimbriae minor subunit 2 [Yersinia nurmii]|uniref:Alpha-related fimbriae minor subunit 2 n=1 Tax=Yersinia nurmii TaxID=685706 RepID=A0ABM9SLM4_9GAMM|nr:hypothetical protein [Yersinia nurmii]CNF03394.1 alpha-related fimbriae minor subunit 2 [Yersinia nurmii]